MTEDLADKDHLPGSEACLATYRVWANGGWGLIITGKSLINYVPSTKRIKFVCSIKLTLN
jgi:2,4-dienoyl-CoA reductase-like NADH-dependent reductase (Old Yellow Enzyme family)